METAFKADKLFENEVKMRVYTYVTARIFALTSFVPC